MASRATRRRRVVAADDLFRLGFVADPQISPDGTQVAYVVAWVDPNDHTRYRSQLKLAKFDATEPPRNLTTGQHRDASPRWSPDGCSLAFVSDRDDSRAQTFVLPLQGGQPRQLTRLKRRAAAPIRTPTAHLLTYLPPLSALQIPH